jgi:tetratricopeptide (TPR) repeat protein
VGNVEGALEAYREADRADPSSPALHRAAVLAARMGRRRQAYKAYRELCRRDSSSAACKRRDEIGRELGAPTGGD